MNESLRTNWGLFNNCLIGIKFLAFVLWLGFGWDVADRNFIVLAGCLGVRQTFKLKLANLGNFVSCLCLTIFYVDYLFAFIFDFLEVVL